MTGHHQHPDPDFEESRDVRQYQGDDVDPTRIPDGVIVPDPGMYFRVWHLWLLYAMTALTIGTTAAAALSYSTQTANTKRVSDTVAENTDLICSSARVRQIIPPETAQEKALQKLNVKTDASCVRTRGTG